MSFFGEEEITERQQRRAKFWVSVREQEQWARKFVRSINNARSRRQHIVIADCLNASGNEAETNISDGSLCRANTSENLRIGSRQLDSGPQLFGVHCRRYDSFLVVWATKRNKSNRLDVKNK